MVPWGAISWHRAQTDNNKHIHWPDVHLIHYEVKSVVWLGIPQFSDDASPLDTLRIPAKVKGKAGDCTTAWCLCPQRLLCLFFYQSGHCMSLVAYDDYMYVMACLKPIYGFQAKHNRFATTWWGVKKHTGGLSVEDTELVRVQTQSGHSVTHFSHRLALRWHRHDMYADIRPCYWSC